jgi:hypothetical protein
MAQQECPIEHDVGPMAQPTGACVTSELSKESFFILSPEGREHKRREALGCL